MTDSRHPTASFCITVALVAVLVAYPLSFGPACWLHRWKGIGESAIPTLYYPFIWLAKLSIHLACQASRVWRPDNLVRQRWNAGRKMMPSDR